MASTVRTIERMIALRDIFMKSILVPSGMNRKCWIFSVFGRLAWYQIPMKKRVTV